MRARSPTKVRSTRRPCFATGENWWTSCMDLEKLVAIDVHTHAWKSALAVDDAPSAQQEAMGRYFRYQPQHATLPEMAEYYRKLKMAFVVFTVDSPKEPRKITNEEIAELAHKHADVAIPFASVNPHRGAEGVRLAKRLIKDYGVKGFKFHPSVQEFSPNDRMAYPLYEAIAEAKLPALFHTGQTGVGAGTPGGGGIRLKYSNPMLARRGRGRGRAGGAVPPSNTQTPGGS